MAFVVSAVVAGGTALLGGAGIGAAAGVGALAGVGSAYAQSQARKAARAQNGAYNTAENAAQRQLDFELEKYDRYLGIYGDIEENLGAFYDKLTPDVFVRTGLEDLRKEYDTARNDIKTVLTQRHLGDSGLAVSELNKANISEAEARADIRRKGPLQVAAMQENFVRGGRDPSAGVGSALQNQGNVLTAAAQGRADAANISATNVSNQVGKLIGAGIDYVTRGPQTANAPSSTPLPASTPAPIPTANLAQEFANQPIVRGLPTG